MANIEQSGILGLYYVKEYSVYTGQNYKVSHTMDEFGNLIPLVNEQFYFALLEVAQLTYAENMVQK